MDYINYNYKSEDPVPIDSEYKFLFDLVNLDQDHSGPLFSNPNEPAFNKLLSEADKINYYRMQLILNYLDSIDVNMIQSSFGIKIQEHRHTHVTSLSNQTSPMNLH